MAVFGGKVFAYPLTVNWAYILAVIAMTLFLVAGILFILDGIHSEKQALLQKKSLIFPAPLSSRVLTMEPLLKPKPVNQQSPPLLPPSSPPFYFPQENVPPMPFYPDTQFSPFQQMQMMPPYYGMEQYPSAPFTQAALEDYFRKMQNNPQFFSTPNDQDFMNYSSGSPWIIPPDTSDISSRQPNYNNIKLNEMVRQHALQQQRLAYNHERLLERYSRLAPPRISEFRPFGSSSLPGRNYDDYLLMMQGDRRSDNSTVAWSRAHIRSPGETYRWVSTDLAEPLPRNINSMRQYNRNESMSYVDAEKIELVNQHNDTIFKSISAYIRSLHGKIKYPKNNNDEIGIGHSSKNSKFKQETKDQETTTIDNDNEILEHSSFEIMTSEVWKKQYQDLVPSHHLLFNMYIGRLNGSIESYGQSLYIPSINHNFGITSDFCENLFTAPLLDTGATVNGVFDRTISSSNT